MKLEFPSDKAVLGRILHVLTHSSMSPEIKISFIVGNPDHVKSELLSIAVINATRKAEALSRAAGLTLGQIQEIDYSWGNLEMEVRPLQICSEDFCDGEPCEDVLREQIEPDDIELEDTVTVPREIA